MWRPPSRARRTSPTTNTPTWSSTITGLSWTPATTGRSPWPPSPATADPVMASATLSGLLAQLLLSGDVYARPLVDRMVEAIEGDPLLRPTHWATASGLRDPYDRQALVDAVRARREDIVPHLLRVRGPVRYSCHWYGQAAALGSLHLVTRGPLTRDEAGAFLASISAVAGALPVEWGHVATTFADQPPELA